MVCFIYLRINTDSIIELCVHFANYCNIVCSVALRENEINLYFSIDYFNLLKLNVETFYIYDSMGCRLKFLLIVVLLIACLCLTTPCIAHFQHVNNTDTTLLFVPLNLNLSLLMLWYIFLYSLNHALLISSLLDSSIF